MSMRVKRLVNRAYEFGAEHVVTVALVNFVAGAVLTVLVAAGYVHVEGRVTNVTQRIDSSCQRATEDPSDKKSFAECAAVRRAIARREPLANPCTSYQRVTGTKGRNCSREYVGASAAGSGGHPAPASSPPSSSAPGSTGSGQVSAPQGSSGVGDGSAPGGSHHGSGGGGGGSGPESPSPESPAPAPQPPPTSPSPEAGSGSTGGKSVITQTLEATGEAVSGTAEVVGGVAEEVTCHLSVLC